MAENFGTCLPLQVPPNGEVKRRSYQKGTTYLALIAQVLEDAPDKRLTFNELMQKLKTLVTGDRRGVENNIRVCLSTNDCFIKVPLRKDLAHAKKNYWKVDESRITEKMVRRHFKGILDQFPALSSKVKTEMERPLEPCATVCSPTPEVPHTQKRHEVKFRSSFSIDSLLLKTDNSPRRIGHRPSPPSFVSSVPIGAEQLHWREVRAVETNRRLSWEGPLIDTQRFTRSAESYSLYAKGGDTDYGFIADGAVPMKRMCAKQSLFFNTRPNVSIFTSPNYNLRCPLPAYVYGANYIRM